MSPKSNSPKRKIVAGGTFNEFEATAGLTSTYMRSSIYDDDT
jgi:hypothetical protein